MTRARDSGPSGPSRAIGEFPFDVQRRVIALDVGRACRSATQPLEKLFRAGAKRLEEIDTESAPRAAAVPDGDSLKPHRCCPMCPGRQDERMRG
jgi:hypothetical protein